MPSRVSHWGASELRDNADVLAVDPRHPVAVPAACPTDLLGRIMVRLTAEDENLVAYGFGGQRIKVPADSVGAVHTVSSYRLGRVTRGRALLILDHDQRVLVRASGLWETGGEVSRVCRRAHAPSPRFVPPTSRYSGQPMRPSGPGRHGGQRRRSSSGKPVPPRYARAPGYRRLRTRPRGATPRALGAAALLLAAAGLGTWLGILPALVMPEWTGAVRTLAGIAGGVLGAGAGLWIGAGLLHKVTDAVRWMLTSWAVGAAAPPRRFFRRRDPSGAWTVAANVALVALVPALVGWGPGVGLASLTHGFRDAALVSQLRADGRTTRGLLIDVPQFSTDDNGDETETDVATLAYLGGQQATDPSIGGRPLPLSSGDPYDTRTPETVVYLPSDPDVAAAAQQLRGSVWHGAPTANLISGGVLTLAVVPYAWFLVLRLRRVRWRRARELVEDLSS